MLVVAGLLFVNPTMATDVAALALIVVEIAIDHAVLRKIPPLPAA